jgi:sulfoxide reductase heme-binding subunit YedZ
LIYLAAWLAITHYWWLVKAGVSTPWKVTVILVVLLLARLVYSVYKRWQKPKTAVANSVNAAV